MNITHEWKPLAANAAVFWTMVGLLVVSMIALVTIPLVLPATVYLVKLRQQALQAHSAWDSSRSRSLWAEAEARRLGAMDLAERREELRQLDSRIEHARRELDELVRQRDAASFEVQRDINAMEAQKRAREVEIDAEFEAREAKIEKRIKRREDSYSKHESKRKSELKELEAQILDLKHTVDVQDYGLYDFENPAEDSVRIAGRLTRVQTQMKQLIKDKKATSADSGWTVNSSKAQGRKMVNDMSKLLLRAYNAEAENAIKTVRTGHLNAAVKRLDRSAEAVERLGKMMKIRITPKYAGLRREELELTHQHLEAVKVAKEEEREVRRREREEAKAQKEFLALKAKQEKEVEHYRNVVAALGEAGNEQDAEKMQLLLQEAEEKLADVERTMANTRAGYVYVASNRGAFGDGIVKIGMTRRLNPDDRLRELSDASVPFNFDKHTIIFSEDAWGLENALHKRFSAQRVNLINMRREYFYATPGEVKKALLEHDVQVLEFHEKSEAPEFEASELRRGKLSAPTT